MSTETPDVSKKSALPHSWIIVLVGLAVFAGAAVYCASVVRHYLMTVPINLCEYGDSCITQFDEVLASNQILGSDVSRTGPELRTESSASWHAYVYDINVPETVDAGGLADLIGRKMLRYNVSTLERSRTDDLVELSIGIGPYEIAAVRLHSKPTDTDLASSCNAIADQVFGALQSVTSGTESIVRSPAVPKQEGKTTWAYSRFEVVLPQDMRIDGLKTQLDQAVAGQNASVRVQTSPEGTSSLVVSQGNVDCVEIAIRAPVPGPVNTLDATSETGLDLSMDSLFDVENLPLDSDGIGETEPFTTGGSSSGVTPRVAIVVDDGGFGGAVSGKILALNPKLTLAILPYGPAAAKTAEQAEELGFEVIAHIPMEKATDPGSITSNMTQEQMKAALDEALSRVPGAVGMNNHMGSAFTSNEAAVKTFFEAAKGLPLYFLDSRTTAATKAFDTAKSMGIKAAQRNVFLDNEKDPTYIRKQFAQLMDVARKHGTAIAICHFRKSTAETLAALLPELDKDGIQLVHASELMQ